MTFKPDINALQQDSLLQLNPNWQEQLRLQNLQIQASLDIALLDSLKSFTLMLSPVFLFLMIRNLMLLNGSTAIITSLIALSSAIIYGLLFLILRNQFIKPKYAHITITIIAFVAMANSLVNFFLTGDPRRSFYLALLIIWIGCTYIALQWYLSIITAAICGWGIVMWLSPQPEWLEYGFMITISTVISCALRHMRLNGFQRLELLNRAHNLHKFELENSKQQLEKTMKLLQESQDKYHELFDKNPCPTWIFDTESLSILTVNQTALDHYGYTRTEFLNMTIKDIWIAEELQQLRQYIFDENVEIDNKNQWKHVKKDGTRFEVEIIWHKIQFDYRDARRVIVIDITERKQSENLMVLAMNNALESARLKSQFLANMSHEIRTPMNGVIGMTELLLNTNLNNEQKKYAESVRVSADSLLTVINDILDFSKIEAGKLTLDLIDFDLQVVIEEIIELLIERAYKKGLKLSYVIQSNVPIHLHGDPGRLRQILINLLSNAIKFTEQGKIKLRVMLVEHTNEGIKLNFKISDTGIGITGEQQERLFQPFSQADGSTTRKYGGTGLGLAIAKQLSELMEGQIGVTSKIGVGSTFWFTVQMTKQRVAQANTAPLELAGLKALVIDNDNSSALPLYHYLCTANIDTHYEKSDSAKDILQTAIKQDSPYDLILLNSQTDISENIALIKHIKSNSLLSNMRLILLSSSDHCEEEQALLQLGVDAILAEPLNRSKLYKCLLSLIKSSSIADRMAMSIKSRMRILLAEDNEINKQVMLLMLRKLGYDVDTVSNGWKAVEALSHQTYNLVLMDCQMPEMDGYEATEIIRKQETSFRYIPIIAMTANAMQGDREKCLNAGMNDYLSKPVNHTKLELILEQWLKSSVPDLSQDNSSINNCVVQEIDPLKDLLDNSVVLDITVLEDLRAIQIAGEPDLIKELYGEFFVNAQTYIANMQKAYQQKDYATLGAVAHALKGSSANLGARTITTLCAELEKSCKQQLLPVNDMIITQLTVELTRVQQVLLLNTKD